MTGYKSKFLRHRCATDGCYFDTLSSWDDIIDCFPGHHRPTDIDGMMEINDSILFLEEKRPGVDPPDGQRLSLKALSRRKRVTVVFFRRASTDGTFVQVKTMAAGLESPWISSTREEFLAWIRSWADEALARPYSDN